MKVITVWIHSENNCLLWIHCGKASPWTSVKVLKHKMGTTITPNTLKAARDVLLEHMQTNFTYGRSPRSSFSNEQIKFFMCREKAGVTALTVFKVNILWKLRNAQLKGNTVGFCDIFSCFNFRACIWIFIYKSEVDSNPYTRDGYAAAGDQQCKLWGPC